MYTKPEDIVRALAVKAVEALWGATSEVEIQKTRKEFVGDYTLVTFSLLKISKSNPEATAQKIGEWLVENCSGTIGGFNVIKGFLNLSLVQNFWVDGFAKVISNPDYGFWGDTKKTIMVEYSSPNTNKPLHLGHIRNNLLGYSVAEILKAAGNKVVKVNLVNDRGIHICKSMIAWQLFANGETPESSGLKGDHLVGKYYVEFDKEYKKQIAELVAKEVPEEQAKKDAPIIIQAQEMLREWEARKPEVIELWQKMNGWVYQGFDSTYKKMGVDFDKIYYESNTYLLGKTIVEEGLAKGVFYRKADNSVWIDLTPDGLDEKLLLRSDGTSVYMTQDLGTAVERYREYKFDKLTYVVGNEQNYHFAVLKLILEKLGYPFAPYIHHLSYGMVELPDGKMKSREGTVVDADDLMEKMIEQAREMSNANGKLEGLTTEQADKISTTIGLGALKYFILKVDPKKTMLFNPAESIDMNGNTAPFIQYTHARIRSLERKATEQLIEIMSDFDAQLVIEQKEVELIKMVVELPWVIENAAREQSPSLIAAYCYDLAKEYNQYYHDHPILKSDVAEGDKQLRLTLSKQVADTLQKSMQLLGIELPDRM